jgi:hypothetical protein
MTHFIDGWEEAEAVKLGGCTYVGHLEKEFPRKHGNCFGLVTAAGKNYKVLNFNHENFEELLRRKTIEWPVRMRVDSERKLAFLNDPRIPDDWYCASTCNTCSPADLIDTATRLEQLRRIARGEREETLIEEGELAGSIMVKEHVKAEARMLNVKWGVKLEEDIDLADVPPEVAEAYAEQAAAEEPLHEGLLPANPEDRCPPCKGSGRTGGVLTKNAQLCGACGGTGRKKA